MILHWQRLIRTGCKGREEPGNMPAQSESLDPWTHNRKSTKHPSAVCPLQRGVSPLLLFLKGVYLSRLTIITLLLLFLLSRLTLIFTPKKSSPGASPNPPSTVLMLHKAECISSWSKTVTHVF